MTTFWFGVHFAEAVSVNLLPLTLYLFTENAFYIGLILAINPMFGFIAQPIVGVLSDRTWTRVGRRAFYLIVAAPIVAATEIAMPFTTALWLVVVLVIVMQFFVDVMAAAYHPMLAEMIPPRQRSMVAGINKCGVELAWIIVLFVGMPWVTLYREQQGGDTFYGLPLYFLAAGVLLVFVMLAAFFLKEKRLEPLRPRAPLTPRQYIRDFVDQPMLLKLGFVRSGARGYFATAGGIDVPLCLKSRSTYIRARRGGLEGRPLRAGDRLRLGERTAPLAALAERRLPAALPVEPAEPRSIRVVLGPQDYMFTAESIETFLSHDWELSPVSDRMGMRLIGPPLTLHERPEYLVRDAGTGVADIVDDVIPIGGIQVPGGIEPISAR